MRFIAFLLSIFTGIHTFVDGFEAAAVSLIQLDILPEAITSAIRSLALRLGITLDAFAVQTPQVIISAWILIASSLIGIIGGVLCLTKKKLSAASSFLYVSAVLCGVVLFMSEQVYGNSLGYFIAYLIAGILSYLSYVKYKKAAPVSSRSAPVSRVNLVKGQKINLTKSYPLSKIVLGLGWSVNDLGIFDFDLDASAFLLSANNKVARDDDFVFYGQRVHPSGSVEHMGDNLTGSTGTEDDEQIKLDLNRIPENIKKIVFTVTIYEFEERRQNFGQVKSAFIRIFDEQNSHELMRYDLAEKFSSETALVFGELCRNGNEWSFNAIGSGFKGGLKALCQRYGVNV